MIKFMWKVWTPGFLGALCESNICAVIGSQWREAFWILALHTQRIWQL